MAKTDEEYERELAKNERRRHLVDLTMQSMHVLSQTRSDLNSASTEVKAAMAVKMASEALDLIEENVDRYFAPE